MTRRTLAVLSAITLSLLCTPSARALELRRAMDDVVNGATRVVHGEVTHVESAFVTDERGRHIVTRATFAVRDYLKGSGEPVLVLEFPGGTVGTITEWVSDAVTPHAGAELVIALDARDGDRVPPATSRVFPVRDGRVGGLGGGMPLERFGATVRALVKHETPPLAGPPHKAVPSEQAAPTTAPMPATPATRTSQIETIVSEDFEGAFPPPGWTLNEVRPGWGPTDWTASSGTHSVWCAGTPAGRSPADGCGVVNATRLVYGPFDLRGASDANATFRYLWGTESWYQSLRTLTSNDGVYFRENAYVYPSGVWADGRIDLTDPTRPWNDRRGEAAVWIAFEFTDWGYYFPSPGAFIDDVTIVRDMSPAPDLAPTEFALSAASVVEGDPFEIDVKIENRGNAPSDPVPVQIQLVYTNSAPPDTQPIGLVDAPRLEPGASAWVRYSFNMPHSNWGRYTFRAGAYVDPSFAINESNERNNTAQSTDTVEGHDAEFPVIERIEPPSASAGTDSVVHLLGSGLMDGREVSFSVGGGLSPLAAPVLSWADRDLPVIVPTGISDGYPASAGSGPVTLTKWSYYSASAAFHVTFGYGGYQWDHWRVPWYAGSVPDHLATSGPVAFGKAADSWSRAGAAFRLEQKTSTTKPAPGTLDGKNVIAFAALPNGVLAMTECWIDGSTLLECDISLNSTYAWTAGASFPTWGLIDVETITLHELGHWLNLRDLYGEGWDQDLVGDTDKVMYGFGNYDFKRRLTADDAAGIGWIYGKLATLHLAASGTAGAVAITASPADLDVSPSTAVPRDLNYRDGTTVTVTAPATSGTMLFDHWSVTSGEALVQPSSSFVLAPGANTATAVYVSGAVRADANASGRVDGLDLILLSSAFGRSTGEPGFAIEADFDRNGIVDGNDLAVLAANFGTSARR